MACAAGFEEWTVDLVLDSNPGTLDTRLVFCLKFNADKTIEGKVFKTDGTPVSDLTGMNKPFGHANPGGGASLISMDFLMDSVSVTIAGVKLPTKFEGRLKAFEAAEFAAAAPSDRVITAVPLAPGDGDTGTASGTQT